MDSIIKFEEEIEEYMRKKNVFKNDLTYLIGKILVHCEKRVERVLRERPKECYIHKELDIIDTSIKLSFKNCTDSSRKDSDLNQKIVKYLNDVEKYNIIRDCYILSKGKDVILSVDGNKASFKYNKNTNLNKSLEALNYYNKLEYNNNINKNLNRVRKRENYRKNENVMINIYNELKDKYLDTIREFKNDILLPNFSIEEFYAVLMSIHTQAYLKKIAEQSLEFADRKYNPIYISRCKLIEKIKLITKLDTEKIVDILDILTFDKNQKIDIICTPLISLFDENGNEDYIISTPLLFYSNIERNALVLLKNKYGKQLNENKYKEESLIEEIEKNFSKYNHLELSFNKKIKKDNKKDTLTDIDMALYDNINDTLIIAELKNFVRADTQNEHFNVQGRKKNEGLNKAFGQIRQIKAAYYQNSEEIFKKCFNRNLEREISEISFIVLSKNNVGRYSEDDIKILDTINFYHLVRNNKGNMKKVAESIRNEEMLPKYDRDYIEIERNMKFAGYRISYYEYEAKEKKY